MQNFSKLYILINFKLNQDYISKNICVQKEEVNNCCMGSCHLNKQLAEDDKKEKSPVSNLKQVKEFQLFYQKNTVLTFNPGIPIEPDFLSFESSKGISFQNSIFRPPCLNS